MADLAFLADHPRVVALAGERWSAIGSYGEALIATGATHEALAVLHEAAAAQPLDEGAQARLIRAYQAAGQREQAFITYHTTRRRLADELGVDPGPELAEALATLLAQDQALATSSRATATSSPTVVSRPATPPPAVAPAQLPADLASVTGRVDELRLLEKLLPPVGEPCPATVVTAAVVGPAGIGKTTLAVHWAHQVADRFPDGQLFVNLHGFDPADPAMSPADAIRTLLEALQVPQQRIPASLDAQTGLYRSLLSGRRMLILLDNARDAEQVRPLLPSSPGCLVLVTSRNQLAGLVAADGAALLRLDLLTPAEARRLLERRLGTERVATEPAAVSEIVDRCAGLPLALAVVAARAATHPGFPLTALADDLRDADGGIVLFTGGDVATDPQAAFSWSYHALTPTAAQLFRLLALHPGPDLSTPAAASLAGIPVGQVRPALAELARTNLVTEPASGRFVCHDLLRAYAAELASSVDSEDQRHAALHRVLDHYLHTADMATQLLEPHGERPTLARPAPGTTSVRFTDLQQAQDWLTAEHSAMLAAIERAAAAGLDLAAWQLAWNITGSLDRHGRWHAQATVANAALAAARRLADERLQASAHRLIGNAHARLRRLADAEASFQQALQLFAGFGDPIGEADTHRDLGRLWGVRDDPERSLQHDLRALKLYEQAGHQAGRALALNHIGRNHAHLGDFQPVLAYCERALTLVAGTENHAIQAATWDTIGITYHRLGDQGQAIGSFQRALALLSQVGDRYVEGAVLHHLGSAHHAAGDAGLADVAWRRALAILDELDHPEAGDVRGKLRDGG